MKRLMLAIGTLVAVLVALAACGGSDNEQGNTSAPTPSSAVSAVAASPTPLPSGSLTVFAAGSLTETFNDMGSLLHQRYPGLNITFNFANAADLRTQMELGAKADIFASADHKQMNLAVQSGVVETESRVFARNRLVVIVPKANSAGIKTLQDLAKPGVKIVLCNADCPVGNYARQFLQKASADPSFGTDYGETVLGNLVSEETNVKQVVAKVQLDEADAGIVYSTDITPAVAGAVLKIVIPDALNLVAEYPVAITKDVANRNLAQLFTDFLLSKEGQDTLEAHGFIRAD